MKNLFPRLFLFAVLALCSLLISTIKAETSSSSFVPDLICPQDYHISCDDEIWNLEGYGRAYISGTHPTQYISPQNTYYNLDNTCGTGHIIRHFKAFVNNQWVSCDQTIWVGASSDFDGNSIYWPRDTLLYGCNPNINPYYLGKHHGFPHWYDEDCSFVGYSYKDQHVTFGSSCDKIVRKWKVIDWCQYEANGPYGGGIWEYDQIIKISDGSVPEVNVPDDVKVGNQNCDGAFVHLDKLTVDHTTCGDYSDVRNNSPYSTDKGADASGNYPVGKTCFNYFVTYGCAGPRTYTICVTVEDKIAPTPLCIQKLAIALMPLDHDNDGIPDDGMAEIWANDFDLKSYDNCDDGQLIFSFSRDVDDQVRFFDCEDVGINYLEMWVTDKLGNSDFCIVQVDVQNNAANIPDCEVIVPGAQISGNIYSYPEMRPIRDHKAALTLIAYDTAHVGSIDTIITQGEVIDSIVNPIFNETNYIYAYDTTILDSRETHILDSYTEFTTDDSGYYAFYDVYRHHNNMIELASIDANERRVDIADLRALQNHLSGEQVLDPIGLMAADLDGNGEVNQIDEDILLGYVMNTRNSLPRKFDVNFVEVDMKPESMEVKSTDMPHYFSMVDQDSMVMDFVFYQKGDIAIHSVSEPEEIEFRTVQENVRSIELFPNPFVYELSIVIESDVNTEAQFVLTDISGKQIMNTNFSVNQGITSWKPNVKELANGVYFYSISTGESKQTGKLMKLK